MFNTDERRVIPKQKPYNNVKYTYIYIYIHIPDADPLFPIYIRQKLFGILFDN